MPIDFAKALDGLAEEISELAEQKGFWSDEFDELSIIPIKLALVHDEVSEALRVHREVYDDGTVDVITDMTDMQEEDFTEELADIIIRVLDLAGFYGFDIGATVLDKIERNRSRPTRHNKRY